MPRGRARAPKAPAKVLAPAPERVKAMFDALVEHARELVLACLNQLFDAKHTRAAFGQIVQPDLYSLEALFWEVWAHLELAPNMDGDVMYLFARSPSASAGAGVGATEHGELFSFDVCKLKFPTHAWIGLNESDVWDSITMDANHQKLVHIGLRHCDTAPRAELAFRVMSALYELARSLCMTEEEDVKQRRIFPLVLRRRARTETTEFAKSLAERLLQEQFHRAREETHVPALTDVVSMSS